MISLLCCSQESAFGICCLLLIPVVIRIQSLYRLAALAQEPARDPSPQVFPGSAVCLAMALDSSAVFQQRLVQLGLDAFKVQFTNEGWTTMGEFAFSAAFSPGNADETVFNAQVVAKVLGDSGHVKRVAVKRLFYESYTMMVSEMKHKVERTDGEPPRKLPAPEREARRLSQQDQLSGLEIKGPLECSDALVIKQSLCTTKTCCDTCLGKRVRTGRQNFRGSRPSRSTSRTAMVT